MMLEIRVFRPYKVNYLFLRPARFVFCCPHGRFPRFLYDFGKGRHNYSCIGCMAIYAYAHIRMLACFVKQKNK